MKYLLFTFVILLGCVPTPTDWVELELVEPIEPFADPECALFETLHHDALEDRVASYRIYGYDCTEDGDPVGIGPCVPLRGGDVIRVPLPPVEHRCIAPVPGVWRVDIL